MKKRWEVKSLGDVCGVVNGGTPKSNIAAYWDGNLNWLTPKDMGKMFGRTVAETSRKITDYGLLNSSARIVPVNSVIMSTRAPIGHLAINEVPMSFNQGCRGLVPSDQVNAVYIYHYLSANVEQLNALGTGATFKELSSSALKSFPIPVPPLKEQKRIVAILDEAFEGLDRARANAEANLQNARELFENLLTLTFTEGNGNWKSGTIGELCSIKSGTTVDKSLELPFGDIPYVKVAEMNLLDNLDGIQTSIRFLSRNRISSNQVIPAGSTIFPKRGGAILTNKKRRVLVDICADLNLMSVFPGEKIDAEFLYCFFLSLDMRKIGSGSSIPQINNYDIAPLEICYPENLETQMKVAEDLKRLQQYCDLLLRSYNLKLQDLADLRQSLLQKAFAGELT